MITASSSNRVRALRSIAAAVLVIAAVPAATAYDLWNACYGKPVKWKNDSTVMFISDASFPEFSMGDVLLKQAMWHWNSVPGSKFEFYVGRDSDGGVTEGNGVNEIAYGPIYANAIATTLRRFHCKKAQFFWENDEREIDEADIIFNTWPYPQAWRGEFSFLPFDYEYQAQFPTLEYPWNFELVALHELGHALGLEHELSWQATMNSSFPDGGPVGHFVDVVPLPDDRAGLRTLYPGSSRGMDLAASAFKLRVAGDSQLIQTPLSASRGSTITVEFTFGNFGTDPSNLFDIGFYLSNDNYITVGDRLLGMNYDAYAGPSGFGTFSRPLVIPPDVPPGTYFLGFIVDVNNTNAEIDRGNNSQQFGRRITIY
jgi:hypothetical protein